MSMRELAISRMILGIVCVSYLLSAALLTWAKLSGQIVPNWKIAGWILAGIAGLILLYWLSPAWTWVSIAMLTALGPWMAIALIDDVRGHHYIVALLDLAGLFAIGYSLWIIRAV